MRNLVRITLAVLILALPAAAALAGGGAKDLEKTPQAKAYRTLLKAVDAGDYEGYKKAMAAESAKEMDAQLKEMDMGPKQAMAFLKTMSPSELKIRSLDVQEKTATLMATGMSGGERSYGTIELAEENGGWKVVKQSWTNKQ